MNWNQKFDSVKRIWFHGDQLFPFGIIFQEKTYTAIQISILKHWFICCLIWWYNLFAQIPGNFSNINRDSLLQKCLKYIFLFDKFGWFRKFEYFYAIIMNGVYIFCITAPDCSALISPSNEAKCIQLMTAFSLANNIIVWNSRSK